MMAGLFLGYGGAAPESLPCRGPAEARVLGGYPGRSLRTASAVAFCNAKRNAFACGECDKPQPQCANSPAVREPDRPPAVCAHPRPLRFATQNATCPPVAGTTNPSPSAQTPQRSANRTARLQFAHIQGRCVLQRKTQRARLWRARQTSAPVRKLLSESARSADSPLAYNNSTGLQYSHETCGSGKRPADIVPSGFCGAPGGGPCRAGL